MNRVPVRQMWLAFPVDECVPTVPGAEQRQCRELLGQLLSVVVTRESQGSEIDGSREDQGEPS